MDIGDDTINKLLKKNNDNFQTLAECFTEPYFYCHNNISNNINNKLTKSQICNRFISVLSILLLQIQMPFCKAVNWLLSDLGKPFLEKFCNFSLSQISEKSLFCVAMSCFIAHIYFANYVAGADIKQAKTDLFLLIKQLKQQYKELKTTRDFFDEANQIYSGFFMPEIEIKKLEKFVKKDSLLFS